MKTLKFIVNNQSISKDPNCDFSGLFPGSAKAIRAEFTFSPEWDGYVKVVGFWSQMDTEYPPQEIQDDSWCMIPVEALTKVTFKMRVLGKRNGKKLMTKPITVYQNGGKR